jgi:glycosyltransferase involved in cell wall biosynthesis
LQNLQKPVVSFIVLAFNQERFVAESVKGALAQTYSPLQVILSDDCSPDSTFAVMERAAAEYRGPHQIRLNRNTERCGIGGHLDRAMQLAEGELIVLSAGDDISLPDRTEQLVQAWQAHDQKPTSIYSDYDWISETEYIGEKAFPSAAPQRDGECENIRSSLASFAAAVKPCVYGCTHAFSRDLYTFFGPLTNNVTYEDMALSFRSHAIGSLLYVRQRLVLYRRHSANVSFHGLESRAINRSAFNVIEEKHKRMLRGFIRGYDRFSADLQTLIQSGRISAADGREVQNAVNRGRRELEHNLTLVDGRFSQRIAILFALVRHGMSGKKIAAAAARCLPRGVYRDLRILKNRLLPVTSAK